MNYLSGACDTHVHAAPDIVPRAQTGLQTVSDARKAGMRAIVLKNHQTPTYLAAQAIQEQFPDIAVFGGLVLNASVGGLNPDAVYTALRLGAKEIWMPTVSAWQQIRAQRTQQSPAVALFERSGNPLPELIEILQLVARSDAILGTGHLSPPETYALVGLAQEIGCRRILITHPEFSAISMKLDMQQDLAERGVFFERCYHSSRAGNSSWARNCARTIRMIGARSTVLASDSGQLGYLPPVRALAHFCEALEQAGLDREEIICMVRDTPAMLLGLDG